MSQPKKQHTKGPISRSERTTGPPPGRSWFFGIGINRYQHFPELNNAVKDVKDLLALLEGQYDIEPECVHTLYNEEASYENIIKGFEYLEKEVRPTDKVLIYYSGHGHLKGYTENKKGFWIPADAKEDNPAQYIRNGTIRDYIEVINSLHTLLISDACFSGSLFMSGGYKSTLAVAQLERHKSRWAFCSGRHDEQVYDGEPGKNSPFAESILYILRNNIQDTLNISSLVEHAMHITRANYEQLPLGKPMSGVGDKGGQYVFRRKGAVTALAGSPQPQPPYTLTLEGKQPQPIAPAATRWVRHWKWVMGIALVLVATITARIFWPKTLAETPGQEEYSTMEINGLTWMGKNLNEPLTTGSFCLLDEAANCEKYGRLYTWEAAQKACGTLGAGWRLPTDEEWKALAMDYGGYYDAASKKKVGDPQKAYTALKEGGESGLEALMGGWRSTAGQYLDPHQVAYFWTRTQEDGGEAWVYYLRSGQMHRDKGDVRHAVSCRCVKGEQRKSESDRTKVEDENTGKDEGQKEQKAPSTKNETAVMLDPQIEKPSKTFKVTLILNSDMSDAAIYVNGEEAVIISEKPLFKTIEVKETEGNTLIELKRNSRVVCDIKRKVSGDMRITLPCD